MLKINDNQSLDSLINSFFEAGTLRRIPRMHRQLLFSDDSTDTIASHSFRVAYIAWHLAELEEADSSKAAFMALIHDLKETRSGDQNWTHKRYVKSYDEEIIKEQTRGLPCEEKLLALRVEYETRASPEARIAKDADLLDQLLLLKEYAQAGNKEAHRWLNNGRENFLDVMHQKLKTASALALADRIYVADSAGWWGELWTAEGRAY